MRSIAYPGGLLDIHFVHEAMEHPLVGAFLAKIERDEIMPTVPPVPDTDLDDYYKLIERRFSNPKIGDTIPRLCLDGSNRQPKFIVPVDRRPVEGRASQLPAWRWNRRCGAAIAMATTDSGKAIAANDPNWDRLQSHRQGREGQIRLPGWRWWTSMAMLGGRLSCKQRSQPR